MRRRHYAVLRTELSVLPYVLFRRIRLELAGKPALTTFNYAHILEYPGHVGAFSFLFSSRLLTGHEFC